MSYLWVVVSIFHKISGVPKKWELTTVSGCKIFAEKWKKAAGFCMRIMKAEDLALCVFDSQCWKQSDICDILKHFRMIEKRKVQILLKLFKSRHAHFN